MEFVSLDVKLKSKDDATPLVIAPIGDIQFQGRNGPTAMDLLKRRIEQAMHLNAWFLGLGDYIDFLSPSNRQRLRAAALYDSAEDVIDEKAMELVHEIHELALKPTKGRWIGLLEGHHYTQLKDGETTDQRLAQMLETYFLGTTCYVRVRFTYGSTTLGDVYLWASHGCGGGMKAASPVSKLENLVPYWDADIFLIGHMSKVASAPVNRVYPSWTGASPKLRHRKIVLVGTGGFSKGYVERAKQGRTPRDGYVAQKLLNPATLGSPLIRIVPNYDAAKQWSPEISVEL